MNEINWVKFLAKNTKTTSDVCIGIGDDCALVKLGKEKFLLKSDLFIEGIHFNRRKISYKDIGQRAIARVLSDFAACGGKPKFVGISAGIPKSLVDKKLKDIYAGVKTSSKK